MKSKIALLTVGVLFSLWGNLLFAAHSDEKTIVGQSEFEKRMTLIPMVVCEDVICPQSQPYWTLIIVQDGIHYELSQLFYPGSFTPPESIEVAGVIVRPGSRLMLTGNVHHVSPKFAIITKVKWIDVVMDLVE